MSDAGFRLCYLPPLLLELFSAFDPCTHCLSRWTCQPRGSNFSVPMDWGLLWKSGLELMKIKPADLKSVIDKGTPVCGSTAGQR